MCHTAPTHNSTKSVTSARSRNGSQRRSCNIQQRVTSAGRGGAGQGRAHGSTPSPQCSASTQSTTRSSTVQHSSTPHHNADVTMRAHNIKCVARIARLPTQPRACPPPGRVGQGTHAGSKPNPRGHSSTTRRQGRLCCVVSCRVVVVHVLPSRQVCGDDDLEPPWQTLNTQAWVQVWLTAHRSKRSHVVAAGARAWHEHMMDRVGCLHFPAFCELLYTHAAHGLSARLPTWSSMAKVWMSRGVWSGKTEGSLATLCGVPG